MCGYADRLEVSTSMLLRNLWQVGRPSYLDYQKWRMLFLPRYYCGDCQRRVFRLSVVSLLETPLHFHIERRKSDGTNLITILANESREARVSFMEVYEV